MKNIIYKISKLIARFLFKALFDYRYEFAEPVPKGRPVIFASNHLSNFDPPCVGAAIDREIHYMAKKELFSNPFIGAFIRFYNAVPIRRGVMDWRAIAMVKDILREGGAIILFPEGTRSKDGKLGKGKFGVGLLAQETGAVIVPVYSLGTDHLLDAFLRRRKVKIHYGRPILPEEYAGFEHNTKGQLAISKMVMERIAELKEECGD